MQGAGRSGTALAGLVIGLPGGDIRAHLGNHPLAALGWRGSRWPGTVLTVLSGYPVAISAITRITIPERHLCHGSWESLGCGSPGVTEIRQLLE